MINDSLPLGATPLTPDDAKGLIPKGISTRGQLDQFESANIQQGLVWAMRSRKKVKDLLTVDFCLKLHKKLFEHTWRWAGHFRQYEVNIGNTPPVMVPVNLRNLCDDVMAWVEIDTYPSDEICIRLHHRMVWVHPFPNGNGRHSRIMADLLARSMGLPTFQWGKSDLGKPSKSRIDYIKALRSADHGDITALLKFAR